MEFNSGFKGLKWYMADSNIEIIASGTFFVQVYIESCALLGYCAAGSGNSLRTFREKTFGPIFKSQNFLIFKDGTDRLSRDVGKKLPLHIA